MDLYVYRILVGEHATERVELAATSDRDAEQKLATLRPGQRLRLIARGERVTFPRLTEVVR